MFCVFGQRLYISLAAHTESNFPSFRIRRARLKLENIHLTWYECQMMCMRRLIKVNKVEDEKKVDCELTEAALISIGWVYIKRAFVSEMRDAEKENPKICQICIR